MGVEGDCAICEVHLADEQCRRCGTMVCHLHYDAEMDLCADCTAKAKPDGRRGDTFQY
jgi:hypothetical protein